MTHIPQAQQLSLMYANCPQPGDWWHDHYCPDCLVVDVTDRYVLLCTKFEVIPSGGWRWPDNPMPDTVLSRADFVKRLSYVSMPYKLWADCIRPATKSPEKEHVQS